MTHPSLKVLSILLAPLRDLAVLRQFHTYLNAEERRLLLRAVTVGAATWCLGYGLTTLAPYLFRLTLNWVQNSPKVWGQPIFVFVPLLLGALGVAALTTIRASTVRYRDQAGHIHELIDVEGDGLEQALALFYTAEPGLEQALLGRQGVDARWQLPTLTLAIRKIAAVILTLGTGGSGGMGAGLTLIGESMAAALFKPRRPIPDSAADWRSRLRRWWRSTDPDDLQTVQLCGVAAGISTLLGAPLAAAFFATEVMYRRRPIIEKLVYALIASLTAYFLSTLASHGRTPILHLEIMHLPPYSLAYYSSVIIMAVGVALVARYFGRLRAHAEQAFRRNTSNRWQRHLLGATITGFIALTATVVTGYGLELVLGPGDSVINAALNGAMPVQIALAALIAKLLATTSTVASGGSGGLLMPSIFFGMTVAIGVAWLFGFTAATLVVPSITASVVAIVNVPLAATLLTVELFGSPYLLPSLLALVVSLLLSHDNTVYRTQREVDESREIMPGYSVRRIAVPDFWIGRTISQLNVRVRHDVNIIGLVKSTNYGSHIVPSTPVNHPLRQGDILIVMGADEKIEALRTRIQEEQIKGEL
ncbi:MAG: chloride channel protein [Caldilineaceae bacterium]